VPTGPVRVPAGLVRVPAGLVRVPAGPVCVICRGGVRDDLPSV
jgi:hypothetical protein